MTDIRPAIQDLLGKFHPAEDDLVTLFTTELNKTEAQYADIFSWLLGESGDFPPSEPGKRYGWRTELRNRLNQLRSKK